MPTACAGPTRIRSSFRRKIEAALQAAQTEFDRLTEQHQTAEELPDDVDARFGELEAEIDRLEAKRQAYDPDDVARGGAFVILNHDGTVGSNAVSSVPQTKNPKPKLSRKRDASRRRMRSREGEDQASAGWRGRTRGASDEEEDDQPLSDALVRDLTAHRTLGLAAQSE